MLLTRDAGVNIEELIIDSMLGESQIKEMI